MNKPSSATSFPIPKSLEFLDEEDERKKCLEFKENLIKFQRELGVDNFKVPSIGGKELDLCKLYKAVIARGGSQRVSNNKLWKEIVNEFEIPPSCTSASFTLRNHYNKCLLQYERKYFLGQTGQLDIDQRNEQATPAQGAYFPSYMNPGQSSGAMYPLPQSFNSKKMEPPAGQNPASVNPNSKLSVVKPVRLSMVDAESKRLVLAFESRIPTEVNWALNVMSLFSCNTHQSFTLENQPYLLESISNYLVYCISNIESLPYSDPFERKKVSVSVPSYVDAQLAPNPHEVPRLDYKNYGSFTKEIKKRDAKLEEKKRELPEEAAEPSKPKPRGRKPKIKILEEQQALDELRKKRKRLVTALYQEVTELELIDHLKMLLLVVRNLSFVRSNEHHLIKCFKLIDIVISLFVDLIDKEVTFNCLDIVTNIAKGVTLADVYAGQELVEALFILLQTSDEEVVVDQCIECLRRLSLNAGNEEYLEKVRDDDIQNLINLLLSSNAETREGSLEILCTISDTKTDLKVKIAHQKKCIERLIGLIASGSQSLNEEKISKLAALTLANLNLAPSNRAMIIPYEQELALIAASDDKTCKIIAEILGDLDSYQVYSK